MCFQKHLQQFRVFYSAFLAPAIRRLGLPGLLPNSGRVWNRRKCRYGHIAMKTIEIFSPLLYRKHMSAKQILFIERSQKNVVETFQFFISNVMEASKPDAGSHPPHLTGWLSMRNYFVTAEKNFPRRLLSILFPHLVRHANSSAHNKKCSSTTLLLLSFFLER